MSSDPGGEGLPSVVGLIPAYNEAERVSKVVCGAIPFLPVVVVDDGSADSTAQRAEEAGATVLRQVPNRGKGAALRRGFEWAIARGASAVITLDGDGQHDPSEIPGFIHAYQTTGDDLIIGERDFTSMPVVRRLSNSVGRAIFSRAIGRSVPDNQSGYRLISRRLMEAMLSSQEHGFEFEVEMIVVCVERKFRIRGIPIRTIYRGEASHIRPLPHVLHFFRVSLRTWLRVRRATQAETEREPEGPRSVV